MEKYYSISFMVLVSLMAIGFMGYVNGQPTNTNSTSNAESYVNSIWGLFLAVGTIFGTVSLIAIKVATNIRNKFKDSDNENHKKIVSIIDDYVLPILQTGNEVVDTTKSQQVQIKEVAQILYAFMGPAADDIKDKTQVKIDNLTSDVNKTDTQAQEYAKKIERLMELLDQLKGQPEKTMGQAKAQVPPTK